MSASETAVELGYLGKTEPYKLESRFFPSKVGGRPAWLDLKHLQVDVSCGVCDKPCIFLCQIYAPSHTQPNAHHRTIFVFICKNPQCCNENKNDNFVVLRCQLPMKNNYYPAEEPHDTPTWHPEIVIENFNHTCVVCGCLGPFQCGNCKNTRYCSKEHQVLDWKSGHSSACGLGQPSKANLLFPEYEILTEPEILDFEPREDVDEKYKEYEEMTKEGWAGSMGNIPDAILEQFSYNKEDKYFKKFKFIISTMPDQVIRYDRGGKPLWITKPNIEEKDIPNCEYCQSPREFEFQILPTMLSHLNVDSLGKSIDWGTLLIYTCKASCGLGPVYKKEFLWKQDVV